MRFIKKAREKLDQVNAPKEGKRSVMMWDCPLCPALYWSEAAANAHIATCRGE